MPSQDRARQDHLRCMHLPGLHATTPLSPPPHLPTPCNCLDKCVSVLYTTCLFVSLLFTSTRLLGVSTVRVGGAASVGACLYVCCWHVHILVLALHARPLPGICVYVHLCVYICTAACVWDMCGTLPVCMSDCLPAWPPALCAPAPRRRLSCILSPAHSHMYCESSVEMAAVGVQHGGCSAVVVGKQNPESATFGVLFAQHLNSPQDCAPLVRVETA